MKKIILFFTVFFFGILVGCGQKDVTTPLPPAPTSPNQSNQSVQNYPALEQAPAQYAALIRAQEFLDQASAQMPGDWSAPLEAQIPWQSDGSEDEVQIDGLEIKAEELDEGEISGMEEFFRKYEPSEANTGDNEEGTSYGYLIDADFVCRIQKIPSNLEEGEDNSVAVEFVLEVACGVLP